MSIEELFACLFLMWCFVLAFLAFLNSSVEELDDELKQRRKKEMKCDGVCILCTKVDADKVVAMLTDMSLDFREDDEIKVFIKAYAILTNKDDSYIDAVVQRVKEIL